MSITQHTPATAVVFRSSFESPLPGSCGCAGFEIAQLTRNWGDDSEVQQLESFVEASTGLTNIPGVQTGGIAGITADVPYWYGVSKHNMYDDDGNV